MVQQKYGILKSLLIIAVFFVLNVSKSFAYFQHTFHCKIGGSDLQIANNRFDGSRPCLDLISQLKERRTEISSQLDWLNVQKYTSYNASVKMTLRRQRADIDKIAAQVVSGVNDLELKLFSYQKKKYNSQLKAIRLRLIAKQAVLSSDLARSIGDGQTVLVGKIISTIGFNYQRIRLIDGILSSKSLDEMMPLLDIYKQLIDSKVTGKSE